MSKSKTVRSGVREISPVSIYARWKRPEEEVILSLERKREGVINGDRGGDDSVDLTCVE